VSRQAGIVLSLLALGTAAPAAASAIDALYHASWAGLPAGEIRLSLHDDPGPYRDAITIRTDGLPAFVTHFRGSATSEGRLGAGPLPAPTQYAARYDLHKHRDRRLSMRFVSNAGANVAERGPDDTSKKPPLATRFRSDVLDPLSALSAIRDALRQGKQNAFVVPVYDGARRFDVHVGILPNQGDGMLHLALTLAPIAGFKGETSEDGDPDDAPRPVMLTLSGDGQLLPLTMRVTLYSLPLVVQFVRRCGAPTDCGG
jgi:hypothetical protein